MSRNARRTVLSFMSDQSTTTDDDVVHRLSLNDIRPDPGQPRHLLPQDLATQFHNGDLPPLIVLNTLIERSKEDARLSDIVKSIAVLAGDIFENGLINPITVYEPKGRLTHYTIETGERRYWAQWFLVQQGKESFRQIRALIVDGKNTRVRQLSENIRRDGLTAVEIAIGLASLIAELQGLAHTEQHDDDTFVATALRQLAKERLQRGTWPQVVENLGYSDRYWHNYLNLLKLCDEALRIAHQNRLPERRLRPITNIKTPQEQISAVNALLDNNRSPTVEQPRKEKRQRKTTQQPSKSPIDLWQQAIKKLYKNLVPVQENIATLRAVVASDEEQRHMLAMIRTQIDQVLAGEDEKSVGHD